MARFLSAVVLLVVGSSVASAEPLPWSFDIRFKAAGTNDTILLAGEWSWDSVLQYATYPTGAGLPRSATQTDLGTQSLFSFGYGDWTLSETPPPSGTTSANAFDLLWTFTAGNGQTATGNERGSLTATDFFTSGSGNFLIDFDVTRDVLLDGKRALVRFHGTNNESVSRVEMTVTELEVVPTPEPATVLLAGIGIAGVGLWRKRWSK